MDRLWRIVALVWGGIALAVVLTAAVLSLQLGFGGLLVLLILVAAYGWMLFAFVHYRQCRQEEFLQVLTAAAEAQAPLAPALRAYLRDRPHGGLRAFWVALLLLFVVPGYYWLWYRRYSYDRKMERVAGLLEAGWSLPEALRMVPGVASRETRLAAALGQDTGRLAGCLRALRSPVRSRLATLWLEVVPRIAYPLFLLVVVNGVLTFWMLYLAPRYQRIFKDFNMPLPVETERTLALGEVAMQYSWILTVAVPVLAAVLLVLLLSPTLRWYFPLVGRLYRAYVRTQVLQGLSYLLQLGQPAPAAVGVLADSGCFVGGARRRLRALRRRLERGEPLADSLRRENGLPRAMVPLLHSAERAGNLPWALGELADVLAGRLARRVQRLGLALFPVPVVGIGVVVGVIVVGLFVPLITIINGLSQ
jgi:type IV pilus assembly protein PilC